MAAQFAASGPARETTPGRGMDGVSVLSPKKKIKGTQTSLMRFNLQPYSRPEYETV